MIMPEKLAILDSEWVRSKRDKKGRETWGYELVEGAPEEIKAEFADLMDLLNAERKEYGYE